MSPSPWTDDDVLLQSVYRRAKVMRMQRLSVVLAPLVAIVLCSAVLAAVLQDGHVSNLHAGDRDRAGDGAADGDGVLETGPDGSTGSAQSEGGSAVAAVGAGGGRAGSDADRVASTPAPAGSEDGSASQASRPSTAPPASGGTSSRGVFAEEIRIGVVAGSTVPEGRLEREHRTGDSEETHHLKVWQEYFNRHGGIADRRVQFYVVHQPPNDPDGQRASVVQADEAFQVFAMIGNTGAAVEESVRRRIIDFSEAPRPFDFYASSSPYAYSVAMDTWQSLHLTAELMCKQFEGRPPALNERRDPTFDYSAPRTWGLVSMDDASVRGTRSAEVLAAAFAAECGGRFNAVHGFNMTDNQRSLAGSMARMRAAGVTTVVLHTDGVTPAILTGEADRLAYYPEYIAVGGTGLESADAGRLMAADQARHVVGINPANLGESSTDWYRAYKRVDPDGDPDPRYFFALQHLTAGLRGAGTTVNPTTFRDALGRFSVVAKAPGASGTYRSELTLGGVRGHDATCYDDVALMWWDPRASHASSGSWSYAQGGRRFALGAMPTEPVAWFSERDALRS